MLRAWEVVGQPPRTGRPRVARRSGDRRHGPVAQNIVRREAALGGGVGDEWEERKEVC